MLVPPSLTETQALAGLECPLCRRPLCFIAGVTRLSFHCTVGHAIAVDDLLRCQSDSAHEAVENILEVWERKRGLLSGVAAQALTYGYADVAMSFSKEAKQLDDRIAQLLRSLANEARHLAEWDDRRMPLSNA